jgi:hypothetical protein
VWKERSLPNLRNHPICLEMLRKITQTQGGLSWVMIGILPFPSAPAKPFGAPDFMNKTRRHTMMNVRPFVLCNKVKNELSWSGQICFKVACIYTDVIGMINSLETGLESKMKINWYPSWPATCRAFQRKLTINTETPSFKQKYHKLSTLQTT